MAVARIRVTVPLSVMEAFQRLSDHKNLTTIVDQVTTSELTRPSSSSRDINGLGARRRITFNGDLLTEEVTAWYAPGETNGSATHGVVAGAVGYDYKVVEGTPLIADHLGVIRLTPKEENISNLAWDIHLKVPFWAMGEIAAYFVCRSMEKNIAESVRRNLK